MPRTKPLAQDDQGQRKDQVDDVAQSDEFLTTGEAAKLVKLSVKWFERRRYEGFGGPPFVRKGRSIRYLKSELIAWFMEGRVRQHERGRR